jgi:hypothetical protein
MFELNAARQKAGRAASAGPGRGPAAGVLGVSWGSSVAISRTGSICGRGPHSSRLMGDGLASPEFQGLTQSSRLALFRRCALRHSSEKFPERSAMHGWPSHSRSDCNCGWTRLGVHSSEG